MRDDEFEWDDRKADENFAKHGVSFLLARQSFDDPHYFEELDPDPNEERFNRICASTANGRERILVVTFTERAQRIRIISARKATSHEQRTYRNNQP